MNDFNSVSILLEIPFCDADEKAIIEKLRKNNEDIN